MLTIGSFPTSFHLGPLTIHLYGVIFSLAIFVGYQVMRALAPKRGLDFQKLENLFLLGVLAAILGARLYHVFDLWSYYRQRPAEILAVWQGGLGIYGGIIAGLVVGTVYTRWKKLPLLAVLDVSVPALAIGQAIGRWGNWVNQEAFGPPTKLRWGIPIEPNHRPVLWANQTHFHPFFLYESLLNLVNFGILLYLLRKTRKKGVVTGVYFVNYGLTRFFLEFLRWDTWTVDGVKLAHLLSLVFIAFGLGLIIKILRFS